MYSKNLFWSEAAKIKIILQQNQNDTFGIAISIVTGQWQIHAPRSVGNVKNL